jgi:hypothetical protein
MLRRTFIVTGSVAALAVLTGLLWTQPRALAAGPKTVEGTIQSVDGEHNHFVLKTEYAALTMTVNEKTTYSLNGKSAKAEDALKAGLKAKVTHNDFMALRVDATQ